MSNADRIEELRSKYEENPRRYFAPLANEFRKAGDLAQAISICREHLPKQPGHMSGYIVFGQTLFEANNLEEARSVFEQALTLDPENLIALKHLGDIARMNGENSVARRWYARVLDADPRNDDIASQLASLGAPTPAVAQPAVPEPVVQFPLADEDPAPGVFATFDPSSLLDVPEDVGSIAATTTQWAPPPAPEARTGPQHEPLDLDFPDDPEPPADQEFEEGILAPVWPDTDSLVARIVTPHRSLTPISSTVTTADALAAFGREDSDPVTPAPVDLPLSDELVDAFLPPAEVAQFQASDVESAEFDAVEFNASEIDPEQFEASEFHASQFETPELESAQFEPAEFDATVFDFNVAETQELPTPALSDTRLPWESQESAAPVSHSELDITAEHPVPDVFSFNDEVTSEPVAESAEQFVESADSFELIAEEPQSDATEQSFAEISSELETERAHNDAALEQELPAEFHEDVVHSEMHELAGVAELHNHVIHADFHDEVIHSDLQAPAAAFHEETVPSEAEQPFVRAEMQEQPIAEPVMHAELKEQAAAQTVSAHVEPEKAPTFVTETMAELLVSQGFVGRAVEVYEELVRRRPLDPVLVSRLAELRDFQQHGQTSPTHETPVLNVAQHYTPAHVTPLYNTPLHNTPLYNTPVYNTPLQTTPLRNTPVLSATAERHADERLQAFRTARERFAELSRRRVPRRTPTHATAVADDAAEGLSSLFGTASPTTTDELAARALADAFGPVEDSGESLFDPAPASPAPAVPLRSLTPRNVAAVSAAAGQGSAQADRQPAADYSFDRFFPDPAMAARDGGAVQTSSPTSPSASQPANEDLAQFSAWLKGLNNA